MADETTNSTTQTSSTNTTSTDQTNDNTKAPSVADIQKQLQELQQQNRSLADENQSYKKSREEEQSKREEAEQKRLKEGSPEERLEFEKKQREKIEQENKRLRTEAINNNVRSVVEKFAKDVHSLDDVLMQPQFSHILKEGIDPATGKLSEEAAKDFVNKVLEAKPFLKRTIAQEDVDTSRPNGKQSANTKSIKELSNAELDKLIYG